VSRAGGVVGVFLALAAGAAGADAQFVRHPPSADPSVYTDFEKPFYVDDDLSGLSSQFEVGFVIPTRPNLGVYGNVGVSYADQSSRPSSLTLSNVEVGVLFGKSEGTFAELSFTLPVARAITTAGYAAEAAFRADPEQPEEFAPDALSVGFTLTPRWTLESGWLVGGSGGLRVFTPNGQSSDLYARFGAFAERMFGSARIGAEVTGSTLLGQSQRSLAARTVNQLTLFGGLPERPASPHVFLRLPIENQAQGLTNAILGLRLVF
jgi:hypothetical protein